jgi:hypothetical protein
VGKRCRFPTRRTPYVAFSFICMLFAADVGGANPEPVAVQVTFVDPVAIRQPDGPADKDPQISLGDIILTDTSRQSSTILVDSTDGYLDITISYQ